MLPPRPFLDVLVRRTLVLWAFARGVTFAGSSALDLADPVALPGPPVVSLAVIGVVLLVSRIELSRKSERLFLANLGYSFVHVSALVGLECVALESVLRLGLG